MNNNQKRDSDGVLDAMGFSQWRHVQGRASIADLFEPLGRCGIYILRFSNGESYVGKAVDVTKRYPQHRKTYSDIEDIAFKPVVKDKLDEEETSIIERLEEEGWLLRNISKASYLRGKSDFDLVMLPDEQKRWSSDLSYVDGGGERLIDPDLRRRHRGRFQRFVEMPYAEEALAVLRTYARVAIPAIWRGEVTFWSCSCLPTPDVYSRVNVNWQEVFIISSGFYGLWFSFYSARSPFQQAFGNSLGPLLIRHPTLKFTNHRHTPGGQDQISFEVKGAKAAMKLLADEDVLRAIRLLNLRLMQKGPCAYGRYHCMDLADRLLEA